MLFSLGFCSLRASLGKKGQLSGWVRGVEGTDCTYKVLFRNFAV